MTDVLVIEGSEIVVSNQTTAEILDVHSQGPIGPRGPTGLSGSSIASYLTAVAISGHTAVTIDSAGKAIPADAADPSLRAVVGVTLSAAIQDASVEVTAAGPVEHLGWTFTPGLPVFLGLAGAITQVLPPSAVFSKVLGVAVTPTRITLDFQPAIFI